MVNKAGHGPALVGLNFQGKTDHKETSITDGERETTWRKRQQSKGRSDRDEWTVLS